LRLEEERGHREFMHISKLRLGIISGGQLGKMLIQEACKWDIATYVLDEDEHSPASSVATEYIQGSPLDFDAVYNFGKKVDMLTFETENINTEALYKLKEEGLRINPDPTILELFQSKEKQKEFYLKNNLPTSDFKSYTNKQDIISDLECKCLSYPFVQKLKIRKLHGGGNYGVAIINREKDIPKLMDGEVIVEEKIDIQKEITIIVARNESGEINTFPPVETEYDHKANLVNRLICPADITTAQSNQATEIAHRLIESLNMCGLLVIEFFLDSEGKIFINEATPRPHNSGFHTTESIMTSQFEQHLRAILNLPLGSTKLKMPTVMLNLLGEPGFLGEVKYEGFEECLGIEGVKIQLYGKVITQPYRRMGHITVVDKELPYAIKKADIVKQKLRAVSG
jgi:5-(carboxyamino)imidazole ribonucleotide synthase